ncbi:MAG: hypothetical protein KME21_16150 [Desmonostoc vinosum HA7617-LM4]|nr:hypothetical protein [Desmonostoc vinosum HA7617-LM4]
MIAQDEDSYSFVNDLLRKIRIREAQLKTAQEANLVYVTEGLENQLLELQRQLSDSHDPQIQSLMSLLDD